MSHGARRVTRSMSRDESKLAGSGLSQAIARAQAEAKQAEIELRLAQSRAELHGTEWLLKETPFASDHSGQPSQPSAHSASVHWPRLARCCPAWPRHTLNLATLVAGSMASIYFWRCLAWMMWLNLLTMICGIIFHGAHVMGYETWADAIFMKYDFLSVVASTIGALYFTTPEARLVVFLIALSCFVLWLFTFGPLKGLPLNPIQSVLHAGGVFAHWYAAAPLCNSLR